MNCLECRGACCEDLAWPVKGLSEATAELLRVRSGQGEVTLVPGVRAIVVPCACAHLEASGRCGIYETRPQVCRLYVPGGDACLEVLKRRRTPEQIKRIRG